MPGSSHTSSYMSGHHLGGDCAAGWGLGASVARDLRALRLCLAESSRQWCAVPRSCIDAAPGCRALRRSSNNILTVWPGRVAQAPRAGRSRTPWSCSPHIGTFVEKRPVGGSARARRRSELTNRRRRCHRQPRSGWHLRRRFANFQRQRGPADPRIGGFRADAPRTYVLQRNNAISSLFH